MERNMPANRPYPNESTEEYTARAAKKGPARARANARAKARKGKNPFAKMAKGMQKGM